MARVDDGERRPLRVAQLVQALKVGGAQNLAVQIANTRAAAGAPSYLYVMTGPDVLSGKISADVTVRYLDFERITVSNPVAFAWSLAPRYLRIAGQLARDRIDVVQTHLPGANYWGLLLALTRRCKVVATVHNNAEFDYGEQDALRRARWRRRAYCAILSHCHATVAVSESVRTSLLRDLQVTSDVAQRLVVVTNGVQIPSPLTETERAAVRTRFGIPETAPLILAAGRLSEQKNFAVLVDAVGTLKRTVPSLHTIIAGDGPQRAALRARADSLALGNRLQLPGNVTELTPLMQTADLFVLPSLWEGLPLVLLEAMACGLPVVASDIAGIAEVVTDGVDGVLVPPGDSGPLAGALRDLLEQEPTRLALSQRATALIRRRFRFERVAEQLDGIFTQIASPEYS